MFAGFVAAALWLMAAAACPAAGEDASLAQGVVAEINLARADPRGYAGFLREFRRSFQGKSFRVPGSRSLVRTNEGAGAVDEAIRFLSRQQSLPPLAWSAGLAAAAAELVDEEGKSGAIGHSASRSGGTQERIERHGAWRERIGEDISYGPSEARLIVMELIIDDGVRDRGHRKNIFDRAFRRGGAACGPHPRFGSMCVIDFAGGFSE
ncbi:MAG TPA: CAP domain-containing protein [Geobacteraceae bacterium]